MPTINLPKRKDNRVPTLRKGKYQNVYQDKRWKKLRAEKLRCDPLCERCESRGTINPASEVHHAIPFGWGVTPEQVENLAFNFDNLMSLCIPCHSEIHDELDKNNQKQAI